jgi:aspartate kinase
LAVLVQKFGGSSVADAGRIRAVANRVAAAVRRGDQVAVVVSAMGDTTDELLELAAAVNPAPPGRELDALLASGEQVSAALVSMALAAQGIRAVSLCGWQAGIHTDRCHRKASILHVDPRRVREELAAGKVAVVAGFQGLADTQDVTTLGRGGSDMTAVALACALEAAACEIYSDVEGVYTADPRLEPAARKLSHLSYEEMLEMASLGAQVLQGRAVEYAMQHGVRIHARSTFSEGPGTMIEEAREMAVGAVVSGVAHDAKVAKICLLEVPDRPGIAEQLFSALATRQVNVDMIIQSVNRQQVNDLCFTVSWEDLPAAREVSEAVAAQLGATGVTWDDQVAKVSVVGAGMAANPGVAATLFGALAREGINIEMISTSEIKISCLIRAAEVQRAVRAVHRAFDLGR